MAIVLRTTPEQVAKNAEDISALKKAYIGGVDIDRVDFTDEDLSATPDFIRTLPLSSMDLNDVQSEQAHALLKDFIKKGYIIVSGNLNKMFVVGEDDLELRAQFGFYEIVLTATRYEINV